MKFIAAFFECIGWLVIVGGMIWLSFFLKITQAEAGNPAVIYFLLGLIFWYSVVLGVIIIVDAIKRGNR